MIRQPREVLDTPEWWQELDGYIEEQKQGNPGHVQSALIPILHFVQDRYGYIPDRAANHVAQALGVPTVYVWGVASFYSYFSLVPKGDYTIRVCTGTACYVRGSQAVLDEFARRLEVPALGGTTDDGAFTLEEARCLGACGQAPVVMVNDEVHAKVNPQDVPGIVAQYTAEHHARMASAEA
jgi:NADH:ubiquinone oxidoreductase subunit E